MSDTQAEDGPTLAELADRLSDVLSAETALLQSFDLPEAIALLQRKREAVTCLGNAMPPDGGLPPQAGEQDITDLRASLHRLSTQVDANRAALEQGLATQLQVIQAIATAVPRALAADAPLYRPDGSRSPPRPPEAYAFLSRM